MREIFICGMKLWQEMRIRKSFLLGCELVPTWATSKVEENGCDSRAGTQVRFSLGQAQHLPRKEDVTVFCIVYDVFGRK